MFKYTRYKNMSKYLGCSRATQLIVDSDCSPSYCRNCGAKDNHDGERTTFVTWALCGKGTKESKKMEIVVWWKKCDRSPLRWTVFTE